MAKGKPHMNIVFVGHVDSGKSTTVGRLLFDSGAIDEATMRKLKEKAEELGKGGFEFAFVMDNLKEERERGVTIDLAHKQFHTPKFDFTIIDAPGHRDFIKNMITGASQADAAVLVVSNVGVEPQTKEHVFLCKTLGVQQMIVALNKMDVDNFDQQKFEKRKNDVTAVLKMYGYKPTDVQFIPVASYLGENVAKKSDKMPWYTGPTLVQSLDVLKEPEKPTQLPLRLPIQDVYKISGIGTVPVGRVESGIMKVNDKVIIMPARSGKGITGEVKSIEMHHEQIQQAEPGDNIGFNMRGVEAKDIARGDVLAHTDKPAKVASEFTARIVVMNHPSVITVGYTPVFHIHTSQIAAQFAEIVKKIDPATGATIQEHPDFIKNGDAAIVKIKPMQPVCIEKQSDIPQLSRFAIRDSGLTVAAGMCIDLVEKK
ncbi:translation elongation factor EF-1 subunit alpha [Candidatus Woesearchaeota archaeon]|nr:translation elongation factor EF-1 subunit alpha [Candidatus Woesearchaeota archaeon]